MSNFSYSDELYHHGIKGQKWGIRRYQNVDGTRTPEGKVRYNKGEARDYAKRLNKLDRSLTNARYTARDKGKLDFSTPEQKRAADKAVKDGEKEINKLIKEAQRKGYVVQSKEVQRGATTGEAYAKDLAFTAAGSMAFAALGVPMYMIHTEVESGNKYRVGKAD